jgi:hypothetical protein
VARAAVRADGRLRHALPVTANREVELYKG